MSEVLKMMELCWSLGKNKLSIWLQEKITYDIVVFYVFIQYSTRMEENAKTPRTRQIPNMVRPLLVPTI